MFYKEGFSVIRTHTKVGRVNVMSGMSGRITGTRKGVLFGASSVGGCPKGLDEQKLAESVLFQIARERGEWCIGNEISDDIPFLVLSSSYHIHHANPSIEELKLVATRFDELLKEVATITKEYHVKIE